MGNKAQAAQRSVMGVLRVHNLPPLMVCSDVAAVNELSCVCHSCLL